MSRICVFGAGAIGGFLGATLIRGGAQVCLVARGRNLAALRERGITVQTADGPALHVRPHAVSEHPAELGPQDIVLVTVKSVALPQVAARIAPLLAAGTAVVFVVNGIPWWYGFDNPSPLAHSLRDMLDPDGSLHRTFGAHCTIGGVIHSACTVVEPGVIRLASLRNSLTIGEPDGRIGAPVQALAGVLQAGGLHCEVTHDIRAAVWRKLTTNLASGPVCLLSRRSIRDSFSDPVVHAAATRLVEEGLAVASAVLGHPLDADSGSIMAFLEALDHKPSVLQDLELGRPTEFDTLFGVTQTLARRAGVATPTLDLMVALARQAIDRMAA